MVLVKPQQPRLHWDAEHGWLLDVQTTLGEHQIKRIADWAVKHQEDRWRSLPPGDKKEECKRSVEALRQGKVRQVIIQDRHNASVIFQSTVRMNPGKSYFNGVDIATDMKKEG